MALVFMLRKSGLIFILVLGLLCLVGGVIKKEREPLIVGAVISVYAVSRLATGKKKPRGVR